MAATTEAVDTRSALRDLIEEGKRFARNWRLNLGRDGVPLRAINRALADAEAALDRDDPPEHGTVIVTIHKGAVQGADVVGDKPAELLVLDLDGDIPALVGFQRAAEVLYTAEWIDAHKAVELGIASRICRPEELVPAIREKASEIAAQPLGALRHTRRLLLAARSDAVRAARTREDETFAHRIGSPENKEAIRAFFEKRPPDFTKVPPT